jgi:hypothetical protein
MRFTAPCVLWCVPAIRHHTGTRPANNHTEGGQGGQARLGIKDDTITSERATMAVFDSFMRHLVGVNGIRTFYDSFELEGLEHAASRLPQA